MKLSPLLREKLKRDPPQYLKCVIEVRPDRVDYIIEQLQEMGISINTSLISQPIPGGNYYIPVVIPPSVLDIIQAMPGVVSVSKSLPRGIGGAFTSDIPFFSSVEDELIGTVRIPAVEIPAIAFFTAPPNPLDLPKVIGTAISRLTGINPLNFQAFTTEEAYKILKDAESEHDGEGVKIAVIDTGSNRFTFQSIGDIIEEHTVISEPPQDLMGHGSHVSNTAYGNRWPTIYGPVIGGAPKAKKMHIKALNIMGAGTSEGILKAIEIAVKSGANVISMSLGGPAQGNGIEDMEAKVINELAAQGIMPVVAVSNGGPDPYTTGSPGHALKAITVASASITDKFLPAWWSSRGPGSDWDKEHLEDFRKLVEQYGDEIIKPDCTALGGGRAFKDSELDELQVSTATGWFEGHYDGLKGDQACLMHGSSQATPMVSGLIACLLSDGVIDTVDDVKKALKETAGDYIVEDPINTELDKEIIDNYGKSIATGWGLFKLSRFRRC